MFTHVKVISRVLVCGVCFVTVGCGGATESDDTTAVAPTGTTGGEEGVTDESSSTTSNAQESTGEVDEGGPVVRVDTSAVTLESPALGADESFLPAFAVASDVDALFCLYDIDRQSLDSVRVDGVNPVSVLTGFQFAPFGEPMELSIMEGSLKECPGEQQAGLATLSVQAGATVVFQNGGVSYDSGTTTPDATEYTPDVHGFLVNTTSDDLKLCGLDVVENPPIINAGDLIELAQVGPYEANDGPLWFVSAESSCGEDLLTSPIFQASLRPAVFGTNSLLLLSSLL